MGWFSSITNVVKKAALAPLTVTKLQARVAGRLLTAASKVVPGATVFGNGARRSSPPPAPFTSSASPSMGWRSGATASAQPYAPPAPSWFGTAAAAFNPTTPILPVAAAAVPYAPPAPTYQGPRDTGGEIYSGNAYDPDAPPADGYGMTAEDARQDDASLYDGGELGDVYDATAIDYERHFSGAAGLSGWSDNLLSLAKGAASGALTAGASVLSKPSADQLAAKVAADKAKATAASSAISPTTIALAGGVGLVGLVLLLRKRGAPAAAVASNPRRRRRRSRR